MVASPARGQLNKENDCFYPRWRLRSWSRETGSAIPSHASPLILHTQQVESGAYLRDSSRFPRDGVHIIYRQPPLGQSPVYRATQLRTDDIHCREPAGTEPVALNHKSINVRPSFPHFHYAIIIGIVFSSHSFWTSSSLDVPAGVTQDFSSTFLLRCMPLFFSREGFSRSFLSSTVKSNFVYYRFNRSPLVGHFYFYFYFMFFNEEKKSQLQRFELTSQCVRRLRGYQLS